MFNRLLFVVALVLLVFGASMCHRFSALNDQLAQQNSVIAAAVDSVHYFRDHYGREVAAKRAIEATLATTEANYAILSQNQRALVQDVKHLPKSVQKSLVSASSVNQVAKVINQVSVDTVADNRHCWTFYSDTLTYHIHAHGDTLTVDTLTIPNRLLLTQYRDADGQLHVTATNTNPMVKSVDIDALIPPTPKPSNLPKIVLFAAGVALGFVLTR